MPSSTTALGLLLGRCRSSCSWLGSSLAPCQGQGILNSPFSGFLQSIQDFCSHSISCPCSHWRAVWAYQHTHFYVIGNARHLFLELAHCFFCPYSIGQSESNGQAQSQRYSIKVNWEAHSAHEVGSGKVNISSIPSSRDAWHMVTSQNMLARINILSMPLLVVAFCC